MNHTALITTIAVAGTALAGCATQSAAEHHVATIGGPVLRGGTVLPTHRSAVHVTIMALEGSGTVVAGSERLRLDSTHAVVLAPNVPHAVEPDSGMDLVLLVHHLRRGEERHQ